MSVYGNTYVQTGLAVANNISVLPHRIDFIIDNFLTSKLLNFRSITVYDEKCQLQSDGITWKATYGNWNPTFPLIIRKNSAILASNQVFNVNYNFGTFDVSTIIQGDGVMATYNFDYFDITTLYGFILESLQNINTSSVGASTNYDLDTAPSNWDAVISEMAYIHAIDKLVLDYNLWSGKLIFSMTLGQTADGSDNVIASLLDAKQSAQERVDKSLSNERFKVPYANAHPSQYYYQAVSGGGGFGRRGQGGFYGKNRGMRVNKYI